MWKINIIHSLTLSTKTSWKQCFTRKVTKELISRKIFISGFYCKIGTIAKLEDFISWQQFLVKDQRTSMAVARKQGSFHSKAVKRVIFTVWKLWKFTLTHFWQKFRESNIFTNFTEVFLVRENFFFFHTVPHKFQEKIIEKFLTSNFAAKTTGIQITVPKNVTTINCPNFHFGQFEVVKW